MRDRYICESATFATTKNPGVLSGAFGIAGIACYARFNPIAASCSSVKLSSSLAAFSTGDCRTVMKSRRSNVTLSQSAAFGLSQLAKRRRIAIKKYSAIAVAISSSDKSE